MALEVPIESPVKVPVTHFFMPNYTTSKTNHGKFRTLNPKP